MTDCFRLLSTWSSKAAALCPALKPGGASLVEEPQLAAFSFGNVRSLDMTFASFSILLSFGKQCFGTISEHGNCSASLGPPQKSMETTKHHKKTQNQPCKPSCGAGNHWEPRQSDRSSDRCRGVRSAFARRIARTASRAIQVFGQCIFRFAFGEGRN